MKRTTGLFVLTGAFLMVSLFARYSSSMQPSIAESERAQSQASGPRRGASTDRIRIIYDAFGRDTVLTKDWGFSALLEFGGKRILFDTGNNAEIFAHNVEASGIDLTTLDFVVMSHRHGDHTGGLNELLRINPSVPIYAPNENFGIFGSSLPGTFYRENESLPSEMRYFDGSPPQALHFGTPWPFGNFIPVSETTEIAPGFYLIMLKGPWGVDLDVMEISLAIDTPQGIVLVVGCGHPTIEKIVEAASAAISKPIHLVVGGLHLLPAKDAEIRRIATELHDHWKVAWVAPAHCTGEPAFEILMKIFGARYLYAGLGTTIPLGAAPYARALDQGVDTFLAGHALRMHREPDRILQFPGSGGIQPQ